jgi:predicted lipid-binding transport protein (Tim44 family)
MLVGEVEAKRLGGGRSIGVQRNITSAPSAAKPAQSPQQAAPAQQAGSGKDVAAPGAGGGSRWGALLGGLAIGGLLGAMFSGGGLGAMLLLALVLVAGVFAYKALARSRAGAERTMHYAGAGTPGAYGALGTETVAAPPPSQAAGLEPRGLESRLPNVPADFDTQGFLKAAKLNFIKLQVANDRGNLDEIREVTTAEMFEELKRPILERSGLAQQTDVVSLNADLLEVKTEADGHRASVRFSGMVWEVAGSAPMGFEEIWHLVKPVDGSTGWLLAGIQQPH